MVDHILAGKRPRRDELANLMIGAISASQGWALCRGIAGTGGAFRAVAFRQGAPPFRQRSKSSQACYQKHLVVGTPVTSIYLVASISALWFLSYLDILLDIWRPIVGNTPQKRAIRNYRKRLQKRGMARFEVLGLDGDRDLIRSLARRLAEDGPGASRLRAVVSQTISGEPPRKGGILQALRRSPLVGADIAPVRRFEAGRKVEL
jgi:hypothetical protein